MTSRLFPGPAAPVDRDDIRRMTPHGRLPDGAFFDRMAMFIGSATDRRHRVSAVFTNEVHDLGAMERATLAVRMPMPTAAQTRVENTKEDVHDIPASVPRSQSCNLPDRSQRVDGQDLRNTLAVRFLHFRPDAARVSVKVCLRDPKSFLSLSSLVTTGSELQSRRRCRRGNCVITRVARFQWLTFVDPPASKLFESNLRATRFKVPEP